MFRLDLFGNHCHDCHRVVHHLFTSCTGDTFFYVCSRSVPNTPKTKGFRSVWDSFACKMTFEIPATFQCAGSYCPNSSGGKSENHFAGRYPYLAAASGNDVWWIRNSDLARGLRRRDGRETDLLFVLDCLLEWGKMRQGWPAPEEVCNNINNLSFSGPSPGWNGGRRRLWDDIWMANVLDDNSTGSQWLLRLCDGICQKLWKIDFPFLFEWFLGFRRNFREGVGFLCD